MKEGSFLVFLFILSLLFLSCGAKQLDIVRAHTATIVTLPSETHELFEVRVYQQGPEFVIYGKIDKTDGFCLASGHVDVAIIGKDGEILTKFGLPIENRGRKRPGWYSANYRARIPFVVPKGAEIRLAFHGDHCYSGMTFDVSNNLALPKK